MSRRRIASSKMLSKLYQGRSKEGIFMGLNMKEKQAVTREYKPRYQKAAKKTKAALLDECIRLTGYHRKSAVRILNAKPVKPVMVYAGEKAVQLKPEIR
jgi:hypothetical protein